MVCSLSFFLVEFAAFCRGGFLGFVSAFIFFEFLEKGKVFLPIWNLFAGMLAEPFGSEN
jgi:hypothetical protein